MVVSTICYFHPDPWGRFPFWRSYFFKCVKCGYHSSISKSFLFLLFCLKMMESIKKCHGTNSQRTPFRKGPDGWRFLGNGTLVPISPRIVAVELLRKFHFDLVPGQEIHGVRRDGWGWQDGSTFRGWQVSVGKNCPIGWGMVFGTP